ncbi:MAG: GAF domain-containing protein [Desulfovibrio sp.]|nr:MAG: GAF domain-containing protein [Desulfovibrio sp.]
MVSPPHDLAFAALTAICQVIDKALDLESALKEILRILSEELSMQRATVTLFDQDSGRLSISASHGLSAEESERGVYRLGEGVTGRIFATAEPYVIPDISKEPLFLDKTGSRSIARGMISFIGVPILLHSEPIGVLNVDRLFDDDTEYDLDVDFLKVVATLIAQFISLNDQIREREQNLVRENLSLKSQISRENKGPYIVGKSLAMSEVERQLHKVAPTKATVLLLGESGVGKTLIARIVHQLSERKDHPFIKVNCAAIPENLLEAELFGAERGAYTGASQTRTGRFEEADQGTIFLDEIGELNPAVQAKLLRVLQEREFERLGSSRTRTVDVRIMAATNRDLREQVQQGVFRPDLYYRLNVFPIEVPPLRDRKEDITGLLSHFLRKVEQEYGRNLFLSPESLSALLAYDWPGNVREMENLVERLAIMSDSETITRDFLTPYLLGALHSDPVCITDTQSMRPSSLKDMERKELLSALERNGWIQYKAADELGLSPRQMGYRVKKYRLETAIAQGRAALRHG